MKYVTRLSKTRKKKKTRKILDRGVLYEYDGETDAGLPNGFGTVKSIDRKDIYTGTWIKGRKQGHGKYIWADGSTYEGNFEGNTPDGFGIYRHGMITLQGEWSSGNIFGDVSLSWGDATFTGRANLGVPSGNGSYKYLSSDTKEIFEYIGDWENGEPNGYGTRKTANTQIEGVFKDGKPNGLCEAQINLQGSINFQYRGYFLEGKLAGYGRLQKYLGKKFCNLQYEGMWKNGVKCGHGIMWLHELIYDGEWEKNVPHGKGLFVTDKNSFYVVEMNNGFIEKVHKHFQDLDALWENNKDRYCPCFSFALKKNISIKDTRIFNKRYPYVRIVTLHHRKKVLKKVYIGTENCRL